MQQEAGSSEPVKIPDDSVLKSKLAKAGRNRENRLDENGKELLSKTREALQVRWGVECRIATVNTDGLRDVERRDALVLFHLEFHINICVATETHLREEEIASMKKYILEYGYQIGAKACRKPSKGRIRGGGW